MSKELYEVNIDYIKAHNGESWIATISDEKYIDMDTFERTKANLEEQLKDCIRPKFKLKDNVYALYAFGAYGILKGQIDAFDYYTKSYFIFFDENIGTEWIPARYVFKTKREAEQRLKEIKDE